MQIHNMGMKPFDAIVLNPPDILLNGIGDDPTLINDERFVQQGTSTKKLCDSAPIISSLSYLSSKWRAAIVFYRKGAGKAH